MAACWKIAPHSAYNVFSEYTYLIVNLVFSHFGFWSGNFFLIAPFPGRCLPVPFSWFPYRNQFQHNLIKIPFLYVFVSVFVSV